MKPKLFVGSSSEGLKTAYAIQENLEHDALCTVWTQGIFQLSGNALDNLLEAAGEFDFAVFVFQPDDILQIRNETVNTVRDNVVFELGLFIGCLGKERVFFLVPKGSEEVHLPTDLIGVEPGHYVPPERDEDLLSALGPFCNRVRRQIQKAWIEEEQRETESKSANVSSKPSDGRSDKAEKEQHEEAEEAKDVESGVQVDAFGNYTISIAPTIFFANRFSGAFPGVRGIYWFTDGKQGLDRLQLLLKEPIAFEKTVGHGTTCDPIWWWRGGSCLSIKVFRRLSDTRCLMDVYELEISKIAVYRSNDYYRSFVYVEVSPDQSTGLYPKDEATLQRLIEVFGYASEEYGLFQNIPITRACYDDGAAVIDGVVVDTSGAELRVRYLSTYNFLIASKFSPINLHKFDALSKPLLAEMLSGNDRMEELCDILDRLPRHECDD
jgi:hypothetical protein